MGKSLYIKKQSTKLENEIKNNISWTSKWKGEDHTLIMRTPIQGNSVDIEEVLTHLLDGDKSSNKHPKIYHFDVAPTVSLFL